MNIRLEQPKDYREVEDLTREAFWNVYRPGCTEHYVLNQYRTNPDFILRPSRRPSRRRKNSACQDN